MTEERTEMKLSLLKSLGGLVPADPDSDAKYRKIKAGSVIIAETKEVRNPLFMRKYFALLKVGFENWEAPKVESVHGMPEKSFDRFRKDVAILCGHYHLVIRLNGKVRIEADSISFAKMTQETFEKLYNQTINVLLTHVYASNITRQELDEIVDSYLSFT